MDIAIWKFNKIISLNNIYNSHQSILQEIISICLIIENVLRNKKYKKIILSYLKRFYVTKYKYVKYEDQ